MIKNILNNKIYEICVKDNFFHLKNYVNIIDIYPNSISILLLDKKLNISGSNLIISAMDEYEILIKGNIKNIEFKDR